MQEENKNISINGETFGSRLRKLRIDKGLSQEDLASKLGYKRSGSISNIEMDKSPPDILALIKIAEILDADLHYLITGEQSPGEKAQRKAYLALLDRFERFVSKNFIELSDRKTALLTDRDKLIKKMGEKAEFDPAFSRFNSELRQIQSDIDETRHEQFLIQKTLREIGGLEDKKLPVFLEEDKPPTSDNKIF